MANSNYRSSFNGDNNNMQMESYYASSSSTARPTTDFSSYSDSYCAPPPPPPPPGKLKKGKSIGGSKSWGLNDPELQRKKRIASYKAYSAEGKVKGSLTKSFRWLKDKYSKVLYGWW